MMADVPQWAHGLDSMGWERTLLSGSSGVFLVEAAVQLIARHGYWMGIPQFLEFVEFYPPAAAGIWFERAAEALDAGQLPIRDEEDGNVLRIAASLVTGYPVVLSSVVENNSPETIGLIAVALMYADGFTTSTAIPKA